MPGGCAGGGEGGGGGGGEVVGGGGGGGQGEGGGGGVGGGGGGQGEGGGGGVGVGGGEVVGGGAGGGEGEGLIRDGGRIPQRIGLQNSDVSNIVSLWDRGKIGDSRTKHTKSTTKTSGIWQWPLTMKSRNPS